MSEAFIDADGWLIIGHSECDLLMMNALRELCTRHQPIRSRISIIFVIEQRIEQGRLFQIR